MKKNIVLVTFHFAVEATFQDVLGTQHHYYKTSTFDGLQRVLGNMASRPDLIVMAGSPQNPVINQIVEGFPDLQSVMVIMNMDSLPSSLATPGSVMIYGCSSDRDNSFFVKCREILGE